MSGRFAVVSGVVTDYSGRPVRNAEVCLFRRIGPEVIGYQTPVPSGTSMRTAGVRGHVDDAGTGFWMKTGGPPRTPGFIAAEIPPTGCGTWRRIYPCSVPVRLMKLSSYAAWIYQNRSWPNISPFQGKSPEDRSPSGGSVYKIMLSSGGLSLLAGWHGGEREYCAAMPLWR